MRSFRTRDHDAIGPERRPIQSQGFAHEPTHAFKSLDPVVHADVPTSRTTSTTLAASLLARFDDHAASTALIFNDDRVSYGDLGQRVRRLARLLIARGVGPDDIVAIALEPSVEAIVAMLGILAAGGAYLPLDIDAPSSRNQGLIEHSNAALVLTHRGFADALGADGRGLILTLDDPAALDEMAAQSDAAIAPSEQLRPLVATSLAYVIYTSGSTGQPKGVRISHGAIVTSLDWLTRTLGVSDADVVLQRASFTFDVSVWEIFSVLTVGGTLVLLKPGGARDAVHVGDRVRTHGVTLMIFVPTMLADFIESDGSSNNPTVRNIVAIGEALPGLLQQRTHQRLPRAVLWNSYGPTEAAVGVTLWRCRREDGAKDPPIGSPARNTQIHLLDDALQEVADGREGELFISGDYLADGYLGLPQLTADKFTACPFGAPGRRMYRSGDIAERRGDGQIYFVGRNDNQIKINGIRVELGEIQAAVTTLPGVAHAAVIARTLGGEDRIIAYVVSKAGAPPLVASDAKSALGRKLPRHLIPSFFVAIDSFPVTKSGKLDASALPDPDIGGDRAPYRQPCGELEVFFARTFSQLLDVAVVGAEDSFFDLGGTSLTAMRLASKTKARTGSALPMRALVERPTPAGLARAMVSLITGEDTSAPMTRDSRPVVFILPGEGGPDIALGSLVVACDASLDLRVLDAVDWRDLCAAGTTFQSAAETLTTQIAATAPEGDIHLAGYSLGGNVAYEIAQGLRRRGRNVGFLAIIDTEAPALHSAAPSFARKIGMLGNKLARIVRDREITLVIKIKTFEQIPPRFLPFLARLIAWGSAARRERIGGRMTITIGKRLKRRWLRAVRRYPPLEAPTYLFRVRPSALDEGRFDGWRERCSDLHTVLVDGDHETILSKPHLDAFVAAFIGSMRGLEAPNPG